MKIRLTIYSHVITSTKIQRQTLVSGSGHCMLISDDQPVKLRKDKARTAIHIWRSHAIHVDVVNVKKKESDKCGHLNNSFSHFYMALHLTIFTT